MTVTREGKQYLGTRTVEEYEVSVIDGSVVVFPYTLQKQSISARITII
jgi:hypothetical protein